MTDHNDGLSMGLATKQVSPLFIQGNARALPLADRSVQCIVTSPPYWGLRDYGLAPEIWGGDGSCDHCDISAETVERENRTGLGLADSAASVRGGGKKAAQVGTQKFTRGFCKRCGAWLGAFGLEPTPELFVQHMVEIARDWWRVLRDDGTLWLNIGDSYASGPKKRTPEQASANSTLSGGLFTQEQGLQQIDKVQHGLKPKDLVGIPWMVAFALRSDGWYLRQDNIWHKPNPMPESVTDRCTKSHEYVFLLTKSQRYFIDMHAVREPITAKSGGASFGPQRKGMELGVQSRALDDSSGRNHPLGRNTRSVWTISTESFPEAHFATFPTRLAAKCIKAGSSEKGCCAKCGAAWVRDIDKSKSLESGSGRSGNAIIGKQPKLQGGGDTFDIRLGPVISIKTIGWNPSCKCVDAGDPVPCTVLDPFAGAFTAPIVACVLGRRGVGVELNAKYIEIAKRRWEHGRDRVINRVIEKPKKTRASKQVKGVA